MAFVVISNSQIAAGEPTAQDLFQAIKDDLDDHESRLSDVEAAATSTRPFIFEVVGPGTVGDGIAYLRVPYNMTVTGVKLSVPVGGTAGTISVDVQRYSGGYASILTGNVTRAFNAGNPGTSSAPGVAISSIAAGTFLRLDQDAIQDGCQGYMVEIEHTIDT
jgi:hypothetical protein